MALKEALLPEFDQEMAITTRTLERVPDDKSAWKPHEKSSTLGLLPGHVATLPGLAKKAITQDELGEASGGQAPAPPAWVAPKNGQELLETFDKLVAETFITVPNSAFICASTIFPSLQRMDRRLMKTRWAFRRPSMIELRARKTPMNALRCRLVALASLSVAVLTFAPHSLHAADALTWQQKENFLMKGKITHVAEAKKGVTGTLRVTLRDGTLTHDASVQAIDDSKQFFLGEVGFKDTYKFDIAGWKLARLLGLDDRVPPSVKRTYNGKTASFTWWVDNIQMDEEDRRAKNLQAPNADAWQKEYNIMQAFDQLIYNMDLNQTNILIDQSWHIWMIDHSRAFRVHKTLKDPSVLKGIDRETLAKMKMLDEATLSKEFGRDVTKDEIRGLLARRDLIVKFFEGKGANALFDRPVRN